MQDALPIFHLSIQDKQTLGLLTMPFVKNGGIFIPTNAEFCLGENVFIVLRPPGSQKKYAAMGYIFWIGCHASDKRAGIGIRFALQDNPLGKIIKTLLRDFQPPGLATILS